jgi:hypothetical protein
VKQHAEVPMRIVGASGLEPETSSVTPFVVIAADVEPARSASAYHSAQTIVAHRVALFHHSWQNVANGASDGWGHATMVNADHRGKRTGWFQACELLDDGTRDSARCGRVPCAT